MHLDKNKKFLNSTIIIIVIIIKYQIQIETVIEGVSSWYNG